MERHAEVAVERARARVDAEGLAQVVLRKVELLLPEVDVAEPIPVGGEGAWNETWPSPYRGGQRFIRGHGFKQRNTTKKSTKRTIEQHNHTTAGAMRMLLSLNLLWPEVDFA